MHLSQSIPVIIIGKIVKVSERESSSCGAMLLYDMRVVTGVGAGAVSDSNVQLGGH